MGFFSGDMEDMLDVFQTESLEMMDRMESYLMSEEKQKRLSTEVLQGIFRIVHTMKSSSAMMGLEAMSSCTHRLEDLFLIYRDAPEKTDGIRERVFDLLYAYVDYIREEMGRITEVDYTPAPTDSLVKQIEWELSQANGIPDQVPKEGEAHDTPAEEVAKAMAADSYLRPESAYQWKIHFQEDCQMESVRAFLLMKQIRPLCGELFSTPEDLQAKDSSEYIQKNGLLICFTTNESDQVFQKLVTSVYVKEVEDIGSLAVTTEEKEESQKEEQKKEELGETHQSLNKMGMVSWQKILLLQNVTGELITLTNMLEKEIAVFKHSGRLENLILNNRHLLKELEEVVNDVSMMPVSGMVNQYNRAIRDICRKEGKEISFQTQGEELEVDKTLIDSLTTPLLHLIRNAADHGIESQTEREQAGKQGTGKILFAVSSVGENLLFSVSDDGRGLDTAQILDKAERADLLEQPKEKYTEEEIYQFIFRAGFSTAEQVTEFSGRGVGLNVVQKVVDMLRGSVYVESQPGEGTTITVSVPVSLTSVDCIQFSLEDNTCFIPIKRVEQIFSYGQSLERLTEVDGVEYFREEEMIPLIRLRSAYGYPDLDKEEKHASFILVVRGVKHKMALVIDRIDGQYTVVEKALPELIPRNYKSKTGINGCAITAEGGIGFILNVDRIMHAFERGDLYE